MRFITEEFQEQREEKFGLLEQMNHILKEYTEVMDGLPWFFFGRIPIFETGKYDLLLEIYDVIFASFTLMHVLGYSDEEMILGLDGTIDKLKKRAQSNYYGKKRARANDRI